MELPYELKKLPPQAIDVIRFLNLQGGQADAIAICKGADLSNRAFGKAIRRLVTRNYLSMDMDGEYRLTPEGVKAAKIIAKVDETSTDEPDESEEIEITVPRRLTIVVPTLLGAESSSNLYAGVNAPDQKQQLNRPTSLVLRIEGVNCSISPVEQTLKVPHDSYTEPATFTVVPNGVGQGRMRVHAYQMVRSDEVREVGGMYFDFLVDDTPSTELKAVGIDLDLHG